MPSEEWLGGGSVPQFPPQHKGRELGLPVPWLMPAAA